MPQLTEARLNAIMKNIAYHGDMEIPIRPHTYEALLNDATGKPRELICDKEMRYVDAPALWALVSIALAKLEPKPEPSQVFEAEDWTRLPSHFLPDGGDDPEKGIPVIVKASRKRSLTADEVKGGKTGYVIETSFPVAVVLATVQEPHKLAERIAKLMTEDTRG